MVESNYFDFHVLQDSKHFASLESAVEAARIYNGSSTAEDRKRARIIIHEGSYFNTSVELSTLDSGLVIEAAEGETPVLYGGCRITGWKKEASSEFWYAEPAGIREGQWDFRLMTVDGELRSRSRLPETGVFNHLTVFDVPWMSTTAGGWKRKPTDEELTSFIYKPGDIDPDLDFRNAELTIFHKWDESLAGILSHDKDKHMFRLSNACGHPPGAFGYTGYILWNTREGMTRPGSGI